MFKLILIRHGFRADQSLLPQDQNLNTIPFDSHLAELGHKQAEATGRFLKKYLSSTHYDILRIHSSPLIRCIETSAGILKSFELDQFEHKGLVIDPTLKEVQNMTHCIKYQIPESYIQNKTYPIDQIHQSKNKDKDIVKKQNYLNFKDTEDLTPEIPFPEDWADMTKNRKDFVKRTIDKQNIPGKVTVMINVAHAGVVNGISRNQIDVGDSKWCCVHVLNVNTETMEVVPVFVARTDHLEQEGLMVKEEDIRMENM